jgi:hypothetical protein
MGRIFRSSSMAEHPAVSYLQLPQVTVVEKPGEFREAFANEI